LLRTLKNREWFGADGFPIAVERREPQADFPPHKHEFSEIVFIIGGSARHVVRRESWPLAAGDVFVIGGEQAHAYRDMDNLRLVNLLFQPEKLTLAQSDLAALPGYHALFTLEPAWRLRHQFQSRLRLALRDLDPLLVMVEHLEAELHERPQGFGFMATALFMQIVGLLSRHYGQSRNPDARHLLRLAQTITQLESQPQESAKLNDLANRSGMSPRSFVRAFRAATGLPPIAYLIQLRINRAAALLRTTTEPVTEIAFRVGFNDSNYFIRQFTKLMGCPPRSYRQRFNRPGAVTPRNPRLV
jgi:AraC-like DNA-binding protein